MEQKKRVEWIMNHFNLTQQNLAVWASTSASTVSKWLQPIDDKNFQIIQKPKAICIAFVSQDACLKNGEYKRLNWKWIWGRKDAPGTQKGIFCEDIVEKNNIWDSSVHSPPALRETIQYIFNELKMSGHIVPDSLEIADITEGLYNDIVAEHIQSGSLERILRASEKLRKIS